MSDRIMRAGLEAPVAGTASGLLCLAATPVFVGMALATRGGEMPDMPGMAASPLGGMALMYFLMAVFHATPWLKLFARQPIQSRR